MVTTFWSTVIRSVIKSVLYFSKNIDQAYCLRRWRPLRCLISLPRSSARTRQTDYLLCQAYSQVSKWATYSKQFRRLPVVIDQYWQSFSPLSDAKGDTRGGLWSTWWLYQPCWRDLKKNERITIRQSHVKERKHDKAPWVRIQIYIHRIV